jgi:predicted nucleic acid-binding protein
MGSSTALTDPSAQLVADASTIINLTATGCARAIVSALPNRLVVVDVVHGELETGRQRGREACDGLKELAAAGVIEIVDLGDDAAPYFEELVIGPAAATLDDGEAATIAYALSHSGTALIDERKAIRICAERFPHLRVACTVDVLIHPQVQRQLGAETLAQAVFNALDAGRMRVLPRYLARIVELIGPERAMLCQSLPRRVRVTSQESPNTDPERKNDEATGNGSPV